MVESATDGTKKKGIVGEETADACQATPLAELIDEYAETYR